LNTTDHLVWYSVFLLQDYGVALRFTPRVIIDAGAYSGLYKGYLADKYPDATIIAPSPIRPNSGS
jgi:hypothetical protein